VAARDMSPLQHVFALSGGSGDDFGDAADEVTVLGEVLTLIDEPVPSEAEFRPSPLLNRDDLSWPASEVLQLVEDKAITPDEMRAHITTVIAEIRKLESRGQAY
jgi:hypothetical protein